MNAIQTDSYGLGNLINSASSAGELAESLAKRAETAISITLGVGKTVTGTGTLRELSEELGSLGTYLGRVRDRLLAADDRLPKHIIEELKSEEANALRELNKSLNDATGYSPESLAASEKKGRESADKIVNGPLASSKPWTDEEFELVTTELEELAEDPVAAGAFYSQLRDNSRDSELGVYAITRGLATYQEDKGFNDPRKTHSQEDKRVLDKIDGALVDLGRMMSGANAADTLPENFADGIAETFAIAPEHLAALLSFGTFDEDFLVDLEDSMFTKNQDSIKQHQSPLYYSNSNGLVPGSKHPDGFYFESDAMTALLAATARTPGAAKRILYPGEVMVGYDKGSEGRKKWEYYAERNYGNYPDEGTANGLALASEAIVQSNVGQSAERDQLAGYAARDLIIALDGRAGNIGLPGSEAVAGVLATYPDRLGDAAAYPGKSVIADVSDGQPQFLSNSVNDLLQQIGKNPEAADELQSAIINNWDDYAGVDVPEGDIDELLASRMRALGALLGARGKHAADQAAFEDAAIGMMIDLAGNIAKLAPPKGPGQSQAIAFAQQELKEWLATPDGRVTLASYAGADKYSELGNALVTASMLQNGVIGVVDATSLEPFVVDGVVDVQKVIESPDNFKDAVDKARGEKIDFHEAKGAYVIAWEWTTGKDWPKNHHDD